MKIKKRRIVIMISDLQIFPKHTTGVVTMDELVMNELCLKKLESDMAEPIKCCGGIPVKNGVCPICGDRV
jgi:hypothetical protein